MALNKLVIGLIAGISGIVAVGGITAGVVVSNNRNTVSSVEKEKAESKEDQNASITEDKSNKELPNTNNIYNKQDDDDNNNGSSNKTKIQKMEQDSKESESNTDLNETIEKTKAFNASDKTTQNLLETIDSKHTQDLRSDPKKTAVKILK